MLDVKTSLETVSSYIKNNKNTYENRKRDTYLQYFQNDCKFRKVYDLMLETSKKKNQEYCGSSCHGEVIKRRDGYYNGIHFENSFYNQVGHDEFNKIITNFENELRKIPDLEFKSIVFREKGRQIEIKCCDHEEMLSTFVVNFEKSIQQLFGCLEKVLK